MKTLLNLVSFLMLGTALLTGSASAASSPWHQLGGGAVRILAVLNPQTNAVKGVVEVKLEPGWSTYWRYPGGSGIPPQFDFSQSSGFRFGGAEFPVPKLIENEYGAYAGYKERVAFPFHGSLGEPTGTIDLNLLIGICSEICIPAQADLEISSSDLFRSDPVASQTIQLASYSVPKRKPYNEVMSAVELLDDGSLRVVVKHNRSFGEPALFVEGPERWNFGPSELVSQTKSEATFRVGIAARPSGDDISGEKLRFTLVTGKTGIETGR